MELEETPVSMSPQEAPIVRRGKMPISLRVVGAVLLFVVGYIHLALMVNMFGLSHTIGKLFLLNFIGAIIALVLVLTIPKWYGWALGIVVAGGAAFSKIGMNYMPGLKSFITAGAFGRGPGGPPPNVGVGQKGSGTSTSGKGTKTGGFTKSGYGAHHPPKGHFGPGHGAAFRGHTVLPLFGNIRSLATPAIIIEIAFVVLAVVALILLGRRQMA